jgi:hypothetical protein
MVIILNFRLHAEKVPALHPQADLKGAERYITGVKSFEDKDSAKDKALSFEKVVRRIANSISAA